MEAVCGRVPIVTWLNKKISTYWFSEANRLKIKQNEGDIHPRFYFNGFLESLIKSFTVHPVVRKKILNLTTMHQETV
jgi:hypothetical protein